MSSSKTIGHLFKTARRQAGLTQVEVAKKAGISANTYAKVERGEQKPLADTIKKVSRVLDLEIDIKNLPL